MLVTVGMGKMTVSTSEVSSGSSTRPMQVIPPSQPSCSLLFAKEMNCQRETNCRSSDLRVGGTQRGEFGHAAVWGVRLSHGDQVGGAANEAEATAREPLTARCKLPQRRLIQRHLHQCVWRAVRAGGRKWLSAVYAAGRLLGECSPHRRDVRVGIELDWERADALDVYEEPRHR